MDQPGHSRPLRRRGSGAALCLLLAAGACAAGCQSRAFRASALPPELAAQPFAASRAVNLTQLAQPRPSGEQIFAGDLLEVAVSTGLETRGPNEYTLRVMDDGAVDVPLVGPVPVAGLLLPQAEYAIRDASIQRGVYRNPQVSVQVAQRRTIWVSVVGEVDRPGDYEIPAVHADVLAAISEAGGVKSDTAGDVIEITHPANPYAVQQASYPGGPAAAGARHITLNLRDVAQGRGGDLRLYNGSVVMVAKKPPRAFYVQGLVKKPGQFEGLNDQDIRLLDAIAMAGGRTMEIADTVRIYRTIEGSDQPVVIEASIREAKGGGPANILLAPGDVVSVEETPVTFTIGMLQSFVRFGLTAGVTPF